MEGFCRGEASGKIWDSLFFIAKTLNYFVLSTLQRIDISPPWQNIDSEELARKIFRNKESEALGVRLRLLWNSLAWDQFALFISSVKVMRHKKRIYFCGKRVSFG